MIPLTTHITKNKLMHLIADHVINDFKDMISLIIDIQYLKYNENSEEFKLWSDYIDVILNTQNKIKLEVKIKNE